MHEETCKSGAWGGEAGLLTGGQRSWGQASHNDHNHCCPQESGLHFQLQVWLEPGHGVTGRGVMGLLSHCAVELGVRVYRMSANQPRQACWLGIVP